MMKSTEEKMKELKLYYVTNRNHQGDDQWHPTGYGTGFSKSPGGAKSQNLRFGKLTVDTDSTKINKCLAEQKDGDAGNGEGLANYLKDIVSNGNTKITAYEEDIDKKEPTKSQLGSNKMFDGLKQAMLKHTMSQLCCLLCGPSRTADIEQTLVIGAHGPTAVHIILVQDN